MTDLFVLANLLFWVAVGLFLNREHWPMVREWWQGLRKRPQSAAMLHLERQMMPLEKSLRANPEHKGQGGVP